MEWPICITPYTELRAGEKSIYDYVREGYTVPDKVIAYLRTTKPFLMSPGIYDHPFKKGYRLTGNVIKLRERDSKKTWGLVFLQLFLKKHLTNRIECAAFC